MDKYLGQVIEVTPIEMTENKLEKEYGYDYVSHVGDKGANGGSGWFWAKEHLCQVGKMKVKENANVIEEDKSKTRYGWSGSMDKFLGKIIKVREEKSAYGGLGYRQTDNSKDFNWGWAPEWLEPAPLEEEKPETAIKTGEMKMEACDFNKASKYTYTRINKPFVLLVRGTNLYFQQDKLDSFKEVKISNAGKASTIAFSKVTKGDKLYQFDNKAEPMNYVLAGKCLDSSNHKVKNETLSYNLHRELKVLLDDGWYVGFDGKAGVIGKYRMVKASSSPFHFMRPDGTQGHSLDNSVWNQSGDRGTFYKTKSEFEFFKWLNAAQSARA